MLESSTFTPKPTGVTDQAADKLEPPTVMNTVMDTDTNTAAKKNSSLSNDF